jgi:hypothetical protein
MRTIDARDPLDRAVAATASAQDGVIGAAQLVALGLDRAAVRRRVARGWLHRLHRGVYAVGHTALGARGRWFAALLACGDDAVLSHRAAGAEWELVPVGSGRIDVIVPLNGVRKRSLAGVRTHRKLLGPGERTVRDGLRVTTVERTLLDLCSVLGFEAAQRALELAEHRGIVDRAELDRLAGTGRPGAPRLRAVLAEPPTLTRSWLERRFLSLCREHGIPRPVVNRRVVGGEADFRWPAAALVVEVDGREHRGRAAFAEDRRRDAERLAAGLRVLRFAHGQVVGEADTVAARVKAVLAQAVSLPVAAGAPIPAAAIGQASRGGRPCARAAQGR